MSDRIRFGKHEGRLYRDIPTDYLRWLVQGKTKDGTGLYKAKTGRYRLDLAREELKKRCKK